MYNSALILSLGSSPAQRRREITECCAEHIRPKCSTLKRSLCLSFFTLSHYLPWASIHSIWHTWVHLSIASSHTFVLLFICQWNSEALDSCSQSMPDSCFSFAINLLRESAFSRPRTCPGRGQQLPSQATHSWRCTELNELARLRACGSLDTKSCF